MSSPERAKYSAYFGLSGLNLSLVYLPGATRFALAPGFYISRRWRSLQLLGKARRPSFDYAPTINKGETWESQTKFNVATHDRPSAKPRCSRLPVATPDSPPTTPADLTSALYNAGTLREGVIVNAAITKQLKTEISNLWFFDVVYSAGSS